MLKPFVDHGVALILEDVVSREALFTRIGNAVASTMAGVDGDELAAALMRRESQSATSTPEGVAFPHVVADDIPRTLVVPVKLTTGVDFGQPDHPPCDLVLCLFGNAAEPWSHVKLLARLARMVHTEDARAALRRCTSADELLRCVLSQDEQHD